MKKTDLEKLKGLKIDSRMKHAGTPGRFGAAADAATRNWRRFMVLVPLIRLAHLGAGLTVERNTCD